MISVQLTENHGAADPSAADARQEGATARLQRLKPSLRTNGQALPLQLAQRVLQQQGVFVSLARAVLEQLECANGFAFSFIAYNQVWVA